MSISGQFNARLGDFHLDVKFSAPASGISAIYGPSGCGKTTLLRAIAGLDHHRQGQLSVGGNPWQSERVFLPPHKRPVAYVFQEANLFDHLSVQANLEYGWRRIPARMRKISLEHITDLLDLGALTDRRPATLSGGERQRVAIGRALAVSPQLLLMDEPLASLDQQRRNEILPYLESLHREMELPVFYVSHDHEEVSRLADHLFLMEAGRIVASGSVQQLMTRLDLALAHEETAGTVFDARAVAIDKHYQLTTFRCGETEFILPGISVPEGQQARLSIASRDVSLSLSRAVDSSILNTIGTRIESISTAQDGRVTVRLMAGDLAILCRLTTKSAERLNLQPGMPVYAQVKSIALSGPARGS
jgi:molybdate transport system ATP-binding protein